MDDLQAKFEEARQLAQYYFERYRYLLCATQDRQALEFEDENAAEWPWLKEGCGKPSPLDESRRFGRECWKLIQESCVMDELEYGDPGTPEYNLWVQKWVVRELAEQMTWLKETNETID